MFFIFTSSLAWADQCSLKKISLYGDVVFFNKQNSKVEKEILYNIFPKIWTVNGDRFYKLYLKNESDQKITDVEIDLKSTKVNEFKFNKKLKIGNNKNSKDLQEIEGIIFNKDILPNYKLLPVKMKLKIFAKDQKVCEQEFKLEVVQ